MKKTTIAKILSHKDCYGYFWKLSNGRYYWQNDNDLGLMLDDWANDPVTVVRKVKCGKGKLYQIRNRPGFVCDPDEDYPGDTLKEVIEYIHEGHLGCEAQSIR